MRTCGDDKAAPDCTGAGSLKKGGEGMKYMPVLEPNDKGGFVVYFPDLPGCVTVRETVEEALRMAEETLALYLKTLKAYGDPLPKAEADPLPYCWKEVWDEGVKRALVQWARGYLKGGGGLLSRFAREVLDRASEVEEPREAIFGGLRPLTDVEEFFREDLEDPYFRTLYEEAREEEEGGGK